MKPIHYFFLFWVLFVAYNYDPKAPKSEPIRYDFEREISYSDFEYFMEKESERESEKERLMDSLNTYK